MMISLPTFRRFAFDARFVWISFCLVCWALTASVRLSDCRIALARRHFVRLSIDGVADNNVSRGHPGRPTNFLWPASRGHNVVGQMSNCF